MAVYEKSSIAMESVDILQVTEYENDDKLQLSENLQTIIVARHGKPALSRKIFLNAREYIDWWAKYDEGGLAHNQKVPRKLLNTVAHVNSIIASPLPRALETAQAVAGDREIRIDEIFVEAPLPPPLLPNFIKFRPRIWGFIARCTWYIGFSGTGESHDQAKIRAKTAANALIEAVEKDGSVVLLAHGWFNRMLRPHLKANGFSCVYDGGDMHWSYRKYTRKI